MTRDNSSPPLTAADRSDMTFVIEAVRLIELVQLATGERYAALGKRLGKPLPKNSNDEQDWCAFLDCLAQYAWGVRIIEFWQHEFEVAYVRFGDFVDDSEAALFRLTYL